MVFLKLPTEKGIKCLLFENDVNVPEIRCHITSLGLNDFKLYYNGKQLEDQDAIPRDASVQVTLSLPGGKGGFGSMLRAIGAQIEKTTNREACRDLSGRRLRDINEEQRLKKWIAKESEREAEKARRRQARLERLKSKPKHNFVDFEYEKEISELPERVDEALHAGMEKASKRPKAAEACSAPSSKKKKLWLAEDLSGSSDSDSQEASSSSGNKNSHADYGHSSRSDASSYSESSSDSHLPEPKKDTVEKKAPALSEESSSNTNEENQQVSSNATIMQEPHESETSLKQGTLNADATHEEASSSKYATEVTTFNMNPEAGCSSSKVDVKEDTTEKVKITVDSQHTAEAQIQDVDLMSFESAAELESLGLEKLKAALMVRGLKCGGTISDRAQRLWKVRGLEPPDYPSNLLAKTKK